MDGFSISMIRKSAVHFIGEDIVRLLNICHATLKSTRLHWQSIYSNIFLTVLKESHGVLQVLDPKSIYLYEVMGDVKRNLSSKEQK